MTPPQTGETFTVGVLIGFLGGLFGKGGSAVATPLLKWIGLPGYIAVASPLPATFPSTLVSAIAYYRARMMNWGVVRWGVSVGVPATVAGALLSQKTGVEPLLILTALLIFGFGVSFFLQSVPARASRASHPRLRMAVIALVVGFISGLLANSGGLLLAPLYARVLKLPLKTAFACSLLVSAALSVPGTIVHWSLGHISWTITGLIALGSIPFAYIGASLAVRTRADRLEKWYGLALTAIGLFFLLHH
ncbi:MAG: sulfite exporter TauE/SafE family protein [Acidobacteria bacterium]|nr:MAG: sulfite exporter TauE/SafE family protein [Acidobacteriota bacterium]